MSIKCGLFIWRRGKQVKSRDFYNSRQFFFLVSIPMSKPLKGEKMQWISAQTNLIRKNIDGRGFLAEESTQQSQISLSFPVAPIHWRHQISLTLIWSSCKVCVFVKFAEGKWERAEMKNTTKLLKDTPTSLQIIEKVSYFNQTKMRLLFILWWNYDQWPIIDRYTSDLREIF